MFQFQMPNITGNNILNNNQQQQSVSNQNGQVKVIGNYSYNLRHCLGEGAYGKVYEGVEKNTQQVVAIKKLDIRQFQNDTYLRNSIISEIEILKRFNHKNIVKFIDLITTQRSLYIITEFCKDKDLRFLIQNKKLNEAQALHVLKDIVEGFKELVKHNVTHRDLKPANILMNEQTFKIADFGFAKYVDYSSAQMLRSCVGSPLYMAPQILARKAYGLKSDVWSIGVIFHEMIYQDVPWKARDERELLNNITKQPFKLRKNIKLSQLSEDILRRTLVIEEKDRISWEELFKMFEQYDQMTRNQPSPFGGPSAISNNKENNFPQKLPSAANIMLPANQNNNQGGNIPQQNNNKLKKSIFENNPINNNINQGQKGIVPQQIIKKQVSMPVPQSIGNNNNNNNNGGTTNRQYDVKRIFLILNNNRLQVAFRHYVCADLYSKLKKNTQYMNNQQLNYEKFILCLAASVKLDMTQLLQELNDNENLNKDLFSSAKELKALSATIRKEQEFYKLFIDEFLSYIRNSNMIEQLKQDKDVSFILLSQNTLNDFSDQDKHRIEDYINTLGNNIAKDILNQVKSILNNKVSSQELEIYRPYIVSAEYILDTIDAKKKQSKGNEVFYDQLHLIKSEHFCVKVHLDKVFNKISKFGFNLL